MSVSEKTIYKLHSILTTGSTEWLYLFWYNQNSMKRIWTIFLSNGLIHQRVWSSTTNQATYLKRLWSESIWPDLHIGFDDKIADKKFVL